MVILLVPAGPGTCQGCYARRSFPNAAHCILADRALWPIFKTYNCFEPLTCAAPAFGRTVLCWKFGWIWAFWRHYPSNLLPGFNERLTAWLPGLVEHHCGVGHRGGFLERLQEGTWCGHVLEHTIIELLNLAGMSAEFGQTRSVRQRGVYRMVFRCPEELVAKVALQQGHALGHGGDQ